MNFVEKPNYVDRLRSITNIERLDHVISGLRWAIDIGASDFKTIDAEGRLRVAKSRPVWTIEGNRSFISIYFTIEDDETIALHTVGAVDLPEDD